MDKNLSLLIVDDDEALRTMLQQSCTLEGFLCESFASADPALSVIEQKPFDILLTDIVLPGMKGLELTRLAKELRPELVVIVMTGFIEEFSYDEAVKAGASDFIKKPFTIGELALRIQHAKMQEKLRELSITDELTGLPNRRGFFAFAEQQMRMVVRNGGRMALLFADVDDFKAINDTHGHQEGDTVLVDVARIFRETFRDSDIIARMSGDEFAIILPDAPETSIAAVNRRLSKHLDEYNAGRPDRQELTISMGVAICENGRPCSIDELVREADTRMYEEKQRRKGAGPASN